MSRPEKISKLAFYLQDKEPLIYLFILNTDFINDEKKLSGCIAGVTYKDNRVLFYYSDDLLNLDIHELYFIIIHEAYHIFKRHINMEELFKDDFYLANFAQDAIINYEIENTKFNYDIVPKNPGGVTIPDKFKLDFSSLEEDAFTSMRLFHWAQEQKKKNWKDFILSCKYVKDVKENRYGKPRKSKEENVILCDELSENDIRNQNYSNLGGFKQDAANLVPVITGNNDGAFPSDDYDYEDKTFKDAHLLNEEASEYSKDIFAQKLINAADNIEMKNKSAGKESRSDLLKGIKELIKPQVNWRKELQKNLNLFYSNNKRLRSKNKSFLTHLWNPRSRYGMLGKWKLNKIDHLETFIIIAVDTSGSCFYSQKEIKQFFSEIDNIANELEFSNRGKVLIMFWDSFVSEKPKLYSPNDWKNIPLRGGGGTKPKCIFERLDIEFKRKNGNYYFYNKEDDIYFETENLNNLPFLIVLTDGYFFNTLKKEDLGIYKKCPNNILFFTSKEENLFEEAKRILYK